MRITLLIDSLESGGAQRQICILAVLLKNRGHGIRVLTYHPADFFRPMLDQASIPVECVRCRSKLHRIWAVRKAIRAGKPDVVIAYLNIPSVIAELASLPRRDYALIVSERSLDSPENTTAPQRLLLHGLHRFADAVVTNSHAQEAILCKVAPRLSPRVTTIFNCVDLDKFRPSVTVGRDRLGEIRILCVGRFDSPKNYLRFLEAVEIVQRRHAKINLIINAYGSNFFVDGKPGPQSRYYLNLQDALSQSSVQAKFHLHNPVKDVATLYQEADILCLASLYEGCSNVICEAMACGKPVLASRVGDNPILVEDGVSGFLFDPNSPDEIASAIVRFSKLSPEQRIVMGKIGRQRAEEMLSPKRFAGQYEELIETLKGQGSVLGLPPRRSVRSP